MGPRYTLNSLVCSSALLDGKGWEEDPVEVGRAALSESGSGLRWSVVGGEGKEEGSENESLKGSSERPEVEGGRWVESEVDREYGEDDV